MNLPNSTTFCMHPFTGLATREDGAIKTCCRSQPISFIQKESLESAWNNETMQTIRRQLLNNERPAVCTACFNLEDQGVESLRQRHIKGEIPDARCNLFPNTEFNEVMPFTFPSLEIKLNNLCNLKCRMCNPLDSTSWQDWDVVKPIYQKENNYVVGTIENLVKVPGQYIGPFDNTDNWWNSFNKLIPHLQRVEFAGGEPLMDPQHYKILEMLKPYGDKLQLKYATNLTTLGKGNRTIHNYWPHFKSIIVNVSIDGYGPSYEYVRGNAKWIELIENIQEIKKIPNVDRIVGSVAVQVSNAYILPKMIEYFLDDLGIIFYTNFVNYPQCLSAQAIHPTLKQEIVERLVQVKYDINQFKLVKEQPFLEKLTLSQIDNVIKYISSKDTYDNVWTDTVNFNMKLDETRNQSFLEVSPEFKPYV